MRATGGCPCLLCEIDHLVSSSSGLGSVKGVLVVSRQVSQRLRVTYPEEGNQISFHQPSDEVFDESPALGRFLRVWPRGIGYRKPFDLVDGDTLHHRVERYVLVLLGSDDEVGICTSACILQRRRDRTLDEDSQIPLVAQQDWTNDLLQAGTSESADLTSAKCGRLKQGHT
jgi:hypothetical protein